MTVAEPVEKSRHAVDRSSRRRSVAPSRSPGPRHTRPSGRNVRPDRRRQSADERDHDRSFRPDVEGLRAVAVCVVVLFHAGVPSFGGGYVGVDVFFVISGFVITKLLLRQVEKSGRPRFGEFYARRARRILPAAALVALFAVFASYKWLGFIRGNETADDARWAAVFLANNHFGSTATNYLQAELPPSPLQNYWSLGVEEQFYVLYPATMALVCVIARRLPIRTKMLAATGTVFVVSYAWSVHYTAVNGAGAYFTTTTRAWELALGGFMACSTAMWSKLRPTAAAVVAWTGVAAIAIAATQFSSSMQYPGWVAIVPVGGTALVIGGGVSAARGGPEFLLGTGPFRWIGKLSFSIYLWFWPVLTIATQDASNPLSWTQRLVFIALSVAGAAVTYFLIENPIRNSKRLAKSPVLSIALGLGIVAVTLFVATYEIHTHYGL
jgi:peptidoglycan/LPS O-acetylase OafA/YrhL